METRLPDPVYHVVEGLVGHVGAGLRSASESEDHLGEGAIPIFVAIEWDVATAPVSAQGGDNGAGDSDDVHAGVFHGDLLGAGLGIAPVEQDAVVLVQMDQDARGIHVAHGDTHAVREYERLEGLAKDPGTGLDVHSQMILAADVQEWHQVVDLLDVVEGEDEDASVILLLEDEAVHHLGEAELVVEHQAFVGGILGVVLFVEVGLLAELAQNVRGAFEVGVVVALDGDHHDALSISVLLEACVEPVVTTFAHAMRDRVDVIRSIDVHGRHGPLPLI